MTPAPTPAGTGTEYVVAVDVGGTLTKVAYAQRGGRTTPPRRLPTVTADGVVSVPWLAEVLDDAVAGRPHDRCLGFGVVVPGVVDVEHGVVRAAANLGWYDVPLRNRLCSATGLSGVLGHDVRSGGLAEWRLGAGQGARNLLFLPLGTGIAGAMVADGRLVDADGFAGEIGHIRVPAAGSLTCPCGQRGCLETVASAAGVARSHLAATGRSWDARRVAEAARDGDPEARAAFTLAVLALTEALVTYCTLLGPHTVVLGGGLAASFDLVGPPLQQALEARLTFQRRPEVVPAALGADAGVVGAGLLAWDRVGEEDA